MTFPKGTGISTANLVDTCTTPGSTLASCLAGNESKTEVWEDNKLSLDASKVFWGKPGIWDIYGGYRYWYNKFGTDHTVYGPSSVESTGYFGTTYHFH